MNASKRFIRISLCAGLMLLNAIRSGADESESWSADLSQYGMATTRVEGGHSYEPEVSTASTNGVLAVAFGMPRKASLEAGGSLFSVPWDISLLLFNARSGKFLAKSGPWTGNRSLEIVATPRGNFLLHLRQNHAVNEPFEETLYLLSPSGNELRKLQLQPIQRHVKGSLVQLFISPSGGTLLQGDSGEDGMHYKVLDTDTLESRFEWTEPQGSGAPYVEAISDREILGGLRKDEHTQIPFLRSFDGAWRELPSSRPVSLPELQGSFFRPHVLFLSNDLLLDWESGAQDSDATLRVVRTDGTVVSSPILPEPTHGVHFPSSFVVSSDGRYFAFSGRRENWGTHMMVDILKMDMTFWPDEVFFIVWETSRAEPVAKFDLGEFYTPFHVQGICFAGDDSPGIAYVEGTKLKFVRVQGTLNSKSQPQP